MGILCSGHWQWMNGALSKSKYTHILLLTHYQRPWSKHAYWFACLFDSFSRAFDLFNLLPNIFLSVWYQLLRWLLSGQIEECIRNIEIVIDLYLSSHSSAPCVRTLRWGLDAMLPTNKWAKNRLSHHRHHHHHYTIICVWRKKKFIREIGRKKRKLESVSWNSILRKRRSN